MGQFFVCSWICPECETEHLEYVERCSKCGNEQPFDKSSWFTGKVTRDM
ncbi:MAG: hypothetical protein KAJ93_02285 [Methanosarcinales archaeon]|nr:hypothetical protein [Methanosarcinales archaeon]